MRLMRLVDKCRDGRADYISTDARQQREMCIMVTKIM